MTTSGSRPITAMTRVRVTRRTARIEQWRPSVTMTTSGPPS
jgi:hypothetical protein